MSSHSARSRGACASVTRQNMQHITTHLTIFGSVTSFDMPPSRMSRSLVAAPSCFRDMGEMIAREEAALMSSPNMLSMVFNDGGA